MPLIKGTGNVFHHMDLCLVFISSQVIFKGKLASIPRNYFDNRISRQNVLLPTFSIGGSKQDFQVANLSLATANFQPW